MKRILLIGGTGVLSGAVAREALECGMAVTMVNRGRRPVPDGAELLVHDCRRHAEIRADLAGRHFDAVIDFLCYTEEQLEASFGLYSEFASQYVYMSSCAVYDTRRGGMMDEDSPAPLPIWKYSVDKWNSERLLKKLAADGACAWTIVRPAVTYGDTRIPYGIMPPYGYHWTLPARILAGKPVIRWNHGENRCNMMRVEDFAVGCVGLVGNEKAFGEAFNICGDEMPSFNDVLAAVQHAVGKEAVTVDVDSGFYAKEIPGRAGEILGGRSLDAKNRNDKIKAAVPSFKQTVFLEEGVARTVQAYRDNHFQLGIDWDFDGDTDRIVRKWCRRNGIPAARYNLGFVDYTGSASWHDRMRYFRAREKETLPVRIVGRVMRAARKLAKVSTNRKARKQS